MIESDFAFLQSFLLKRSGATLWKEKRHFAEVRLGALAKVAGHADIAALLGEVRSHPDGETATRVVEAMTTNETFFFRDGRPFQAIEQEIIPAIARGPAAKRTLRIWCAAVASGQEAYSLALVCRRLEKLLGGRRVEIVGTDLSREMIERAKAGRYSHFEVQRGLPIQVMLDHFTQAGDQWEIHSGVRAMVDFKVHNLLNDAPGLGQFDLILLRNVLVYFDGAIKNEVLARVAGHLAPDGVLLLGAAESALGLGDAVAPHPMYRGFYARAAGRTAAVTETPAVASPLISAR